MKINLAKPVIKYLLIALSALIGFLLIYTYVKFTNDRVYEFAKEQLVENEVSPEPVKEALNTELMLQQSLPSVSDTQPEATKPLPGSEAFRTDTKSVEIKPSRKVIMSGKSAHTCMRELNTNVINNDVVKCTHDHYTKPETRL